MTSLDPQSSWKKCKDRQDFFTKFDEFDALMMKSNLLKHCWEEYVVLPTSKANSTTLKSRLDLVILSTEQSLSILVSGWNGSIAIPGIFVGVGLLFTFIGLVAALYFASQAIQAVGGEKYRCGSTNSKNARGISPAARYSYFQILDVHRRPWLLYYLRSVPSHWTSLICRSKALDDLCIQIERCTRTVTPEMIAVQITWWTRGNNRVNLRNLLANSRSTSSFGRCLEQCYVPESLQLWWAHWVLGWQMSPTAFAIFIRLPSVMGDVMSPIANSLNSPDQNSCEFSSVASERAGLKLRLRQTN